MTVSGNYTLYRHILQVALIKLSKYDSIWKIWLSLAADFPSHDNGYIIRLRP